MMEIRWLDDAWADIKAIVDYHAKINTLAAIRIVDTIHHQSERLADFPHSGRHGRIAGTRELPLVRIPYVLIYRIDEDVVILRVLHSAMSWPPADPE